MIITKPRKLKKLDDEIWKEIPDSNGRYFISNYGRVKSFSYNKTEGQIMKASEVKKLLVITLKINKKQRRFFVHKLVAEAFIPKPSDSHTVVTHLDGNLKNNHISNLQWHTKETIKDRIRKLIKIRYADENRPNKAGFNTKLKEADIKLLKAMLQRGVTQAKIAQLFSISEMQVTRIKRGENWGHVTV